MTIPTIWHPMPMTDMLVRETEAKRKTETRRIVRGGHPSVAAWVNAGDRQWVGTDDLMDGNGEQRAVIRCPYGAPGHGLWMRQAWNGFFQARPYDPGRDWYTTPKNDRTHHNMRSLLYRSDQPADPPDRWVPPMFMPRWACKLFLEVAEVRIERVQEITEASAIAEGMPHLTFGHLIDMGAKPRTIVERWAPGCLAYPSEPSRRCIEDTARDIWRDMSARQRFETVWDLINGHRPGASWGASPWVWVVSYKMLDTAEVLSSPAWIEQMRKGEI